MKFIKFLFFLFFLSCQEDESSIFYSKDCVECTSHQHQEFYMDTIVSVSLLQGNYCIGDTAYHYILNQDTLFSHIMDEELLNIVTQNGYCSFLIDTVIVY